MPDFSPAYSRLQDRAPTPAPLPPTNRLTLLRRRITFNSLSVNERPKLSNAVPRSSREPEHSSEGGGRLREWLAKKRLSRRTGSGGGGVGGSGQWDTIPELDESIELPNTSIIDIPGQGTTNVRDEEAPAETYDPFAHPSPAFSFSPNHQIPPLSPPLSPTTPDHPSGETQDYSITSPATRRHVAAATRSITLAARTDQPSLDGESYEINSDASFPSFGSYSPHTRLLGQKHSRAPNNTPDTSIAPSTGASGHIHQGGLLTRARSPLAAPHNSRQSWYHNHTSQSSFALSDLVQRDLNLLPPPIINANPRWERLKHILESASSPSPLMTHIIPPLTPPGTPIDSGFDAPTSPLSPDFSAGFSPNTGLHASSTPRPPLYHLSLPDFSTFDWDDEPSHITRSSHISLSDTEQGTVHSEACSAVDALGMYESSDDENCEAYLEDGDGLPLESCSVDSEASDHCGERNDRVDETSKEALVGSTSTTTSGLSLAAKFPLPPDRSGYNHASPTTGAQSKLLPSKYRPELAAESPGIELSESTQRP